MASRMAGVGRVAVSLTRSTRISAAAVTQWLLHSFQCLHTLANGIERMGDIGFVIVGMQAKAHLAASNGMGHLALNQVFGKRLYEWVCGKPVAARIDGAQGDDMCLLGSA